MLKIGELFAGYGGLGMGVMELLDAEVAWVSEFDKHPSTILAHRFPDAPNLGDITKIDWATVEPVDIITGGSPCQDLSHAGQRAGMKTGTRSGLWVNMLKAIKTIRPKLVVWENVGGAFSACATTEADSDLGPCPRCVDPSRRVKHAPNIRALGRVLGDLTEAGYDTEWHSVRAADIGAPHGRLRVFVTAWPRATGKPRLVGRAFISDPNYGGRETLGFPSGSGQEVPELTSDLSLLPTPTSSDSNGPGKHGAGGLDLRTAVILLPTPTSERPDGRKSDAFRDGRVNFFDVVEQNHWPQYLPAIARWESVFGRPAPAPTLPTGRDGKHQLSARFVEWMMGLPDGWVTDIPIARNAQLKALGNGVVPQQAAEALRRTLDPTRVFFNA